METVFEAVFVVYYATVHSVCVLLTEPGSDKLRVDSGMLPADELSSVGGRVCEDLEWSDPEFSATPTDTSVIIA